MFVVRNMFSNAAYRRDIFAKLVEQGDLDASILADGDPLGFLVAEGAAQSITDAAYRYARHSRESMSSCSEPATRPTSRTTSIRSSGRLWRRRSSSGFTPRSDT